MFKITYRPPTIMEAQITRILRSFLLIAANEIYIIPFVSPNQNRPGRAVQHLSHSSKFQPIH